MHLCRTCRHRATSHEGGDRGYTACPCCRGGGDIDPEPILVQTFALPGWQPEPLYPPGSSWNAGSTHRLDLCGCGRCRAQFAELDGSAQPSGRSPG